MAHFPYHRTFHRGFPLMGFVSRYNRGMIRAQYTQGETITATVTAATAAGAVFKYWPVRSSLVDAAAKALVSSTKSSLSVGEISMTDKTAEEIAALGGLVNGGIAASGGSVAMVKGSGGVWSAKVDTGAMYGDYKYSILVEDDGIVTATESGGFAVIGDANDAITGGGAFYIHTRF